MKKKNELMNMTKGYVGSGVILGAGSSILGGMGQGAIAGQVITPTSNMMGPMITAGYGMHVVKIFSNKKKKGGY